MRKLLLSLGLVAACADDIRSNEPLILSPPSGVAGPLGSGFPAVSSARPLAPLSGGTLKAYTAAPLIVVADPDRSRIVVFDRERQALHERTLPEGAQPFRIVEHAGRVSVALRGTGEIASFDPRVEAPLLRRAVCAMPRGIAYDAEGSRLIVACAGGELVTLAEPDGPATVVARLEPDLRDVVVDGDVVLVTHFRAASATALSRDGFVPLSTVRPRAVGRGQSASADVAWRAVPAPDGGAIVIHQFAQNAPVVPSPGGYGGAFDPCGGSSSIVANALSLVTPGGARSMSLPFVGLPLDVAVDARGDRVAVLLDNPFGPRVFLANAADLTEEPSGVDELGCDATPPAPMEPAPINATGPITALDIAPDGEVVAFQPEPALLHIGASIVTLGGESVEDTGRRAFHEVTGAGLACASCHAEGGDDGHTWDFFGIGARRTQNLAGGLGESAPFHWSGDMASFGTLVREVMTGRMLGPNLAEDEVDALKGWIDRIPSYTPSAPADLTSVERGRQVFHRADVGCDSCHSGARLGHVRPSFDVGTGGEFQVPSLTGLAFRAPFLHDGCAKTLAQRFGEGCGGGDRHGRTSQLSAAELADLVAYLASL